MGNVHRYRNDIIAITHTGHRIADDILFELKKAYPHIGIGSIYRNLNELVEEGILMKQTGLGKKIIYEKKKPHHGHLFCTASGYIVDVDISFLKVENLPIPDNFCTNEVQVIITGHFTNKEGEPCHIGGKLPT